jgi:hypothetical protein
MTAMQLSGADEYFTHQTALPHTMVATSDPSWRERYWVSFQDTGSGDTVLTLGLGRYPNQDVMEAFVCLSRAGRQTNGQFVADTVARLPRHASGATGMRRARAVA